MTAGFYEFFAGAGMARAGLGSDWQCLFANDIDHKKCATYAQNWGRNEILPSDVKKLTTSDLPGMADLIWASFPCQDLSLAGSGAGLRGDRSGTFWPFWSLVSDLIAEGRAPAIIALENVPATLTSHGGKDLEALCMALVSGGYRIGARVVDAVLFTPQSRPRLFLIAVRSDIPIPDVLIDTSANLTHIDRAVGAAHIRLQARVGAEPGLRPVLKNWINWRLPTQEPTKVRLADVLEPNPKIEWHSQADTAALLAQMSVINQRKVEQARQSNLQVFGTAYRRTRVESGVKSVRTEVRFDGIAGCLRTPAGGSSRQIVIEIEGSRSRSRLMTVREGARLMGLPDSYKLPSAYNEGYHLVGDGVAVGAVRYLSRSLFLPILDSVQAALRQAA